MYYFVTQDTINETIDKAITRITCLQVEATLLELEGSFDRADKLNTLSISLKAAVDTLKNKVLTEKEQFDLVQFLKAKGDLEKIKNVYGYDCLSDTGACVPLSGGATLTLPIDHLDNSQIINTGFYTHADIDAHIDARDNPHQVSFAQLTDTDVTGIETGDIPIWDGTQWIVGDSPVSARNGLNTLTGQVELGGDLYVDTEIQTSGFDFSITNGTDKLEFTDSLSVLVSEYNASGVFNRTSLAFSQGEFVLRHFYSSPSNPASIFRLVVGNNLCNFVDSRSTTRGIEYGGDYEDGFQPRTLVTKQYVDNKAYKAGSGLTDDTVLKQIDLGGTLTKNAEIGLSTYDLSFTDGDNYFKYENDRSENYLVGSVSYSYSSFQAGLYRIETGSYVPATLSTEATSRLTMGVNVFEAFSVNGTGVTYNTDYRDTLTDLSLTHVLYHKNYLLGKPISSSLKNVSDTTPENRYIKWNPVTQTFTLGEVVGGGGGSTYSAEAPIVITGNVISLLDNGVTAGTYDLPTIDVTAKGLITNAYSNTVGNGLTFSGATGSPREIRLGGTLTSETTIDQNNNLFQILGRDDADRSTDIRLGGTYLTIKTKRYQDVEYADSFFEARDGNFELRHTYNDVNSNNFNFDLKARDGEMVFTDSRTVTRGIEYAANYSSGFTDHSLITKKYYFDNLPTAGSGLSLSSAMYHLGGAVTQDVTLNGTLDSTAYQWDFNITNMVSFNVAVGTDDSDKQNIKFDNTGLEIGKNDFSIAADSYFKASDTDITLNRPVLVTVNDFTVSSSTEDKLLYTDTTDEVVFIGLNGTKPVKGTAYPNTVSLHVTGDIYTTNDVIINSDVRTKENIVPIDSALDKVTSIGGYSYNLKEDGSPNIGVLAQEVQKVLPNAVKGEDRLSVSYSSLVAVMFSAMKEMKLELDKLKNQKHGN